jgi:hypothetical protein
MGWIKPIWLIVLVSLISAFFFNELNLSTLSEERLQEGQTVKTSDDWSYLSPAKNYYKTGVWKENIPGKVSYFQRPPGYGILYYCCLLLSETHALLLLKIFQVLLFSLSVFCLYKICMRLLNNEKIALIVAAIYGITPFAMGFLYYSLTEGITPALLIFYIHFLVYANVARFKKQQNFLFGVAALIFAYLFIVRPVLGVFGLLLPVFIYYSYAYWFKKVIIFGAIASSFMVIWQVRNYTITGEYVGLHPIFQQDNNSLYRSPSAAFWDFNESWGVEGAEYHSYSLPFWQAAIKGDVSKTHIDKILAAFPEYVVDYFGRDRLTKVFKDYQKAILIQKPYYEQGLAMPLHKIPEEEIVVEEFNQFIREFKKEFWIQYYIVSPLKVFKVMAFHSNLSMSIFPSTFRGNFIMEFFRLLFFSLHGLCFLALFANLIWFKRNTPLENVLYIATFIYVFYLCYFQRGIEERYTLPILSILLIGVFSLANKVKSVYTERIESVS